MTRKTLITLVSALFLSLLLALPTLSKVTEKEKKAASQATFDVLDISYNEIVVTSVVLVPARLPILITVTLTSSPEPEEGCL